MKIGFSIMKKICLVGERKIIFHKREEERSGGFRKTLKRRR